MVLQAEPLGAAFALIGLLSTVHTAVGAQRALITEIAPAVLAAQCHVAWACKRVKETQNLNVILNINCKSNASVRNLVCWILAA